MEFCHISSKLPKGDVYQTPLIGVSKRGISPSFNIFPLSFKEGCIISAVFNSFCHSHASGNLEIMPNHINLDSRSRIKYRTSFTGMTTFDTKPIQEKGDTGGEVIDNLELLLPYG